MNRTLWVFGDSFSEEQRDIPGYNQRKQYSVEFLGKENYDCWGKLLADKLGFQYRNHAGVNGLETKNISAGNTNDDLLTNVTHFSNEYKEGDIIILGFTDITRFKLPSLLGDVKSVLVSENSESHDFLTNNECKKIHTLRNSNIGYYIEEFYTRIKPLIRLSKILKFDIYYWSWISKIEEEASKLDIFNEMNFILHEIMSNFNEVNYDYNRLINHFGVEFDSISNHTKNQISDCHQSEPCHIKHAELFYQYLKDK